jgi:mono/diheme cytochrome c family protein
MKALKNKFYALILIPLFILCLASSYGAENSGTEEKPKQKQDKSGDFIRGAQVWASNCTRCHNVRDPKEFNDREWQVIVSHMRIRAGLTGQEARDTLEFMQQSNNY